MYISISISINACLHTKKKGNKKMNKNNVDFDNLNKLAQLFDCEYTFDDFDFELLKVELQESFQDLNKFELIQIYHAFSKMQLNEQNEENKEINNLYENTLYAVTDIYSYVFYYKYLINEDYKCIYEKEIENNYNNYHSFLKMIIDENVLIIIEYDIYTYNDENTDITNVKEINLNTFEIKEIEKAFYE